MTKMPNKTILLTVFVLFPLLFMVYGTIKEEIPQVKAIPFSPAITAKQTEMSNLFKSDAEPTTKDAMWKDSFFYVTVIDNGSDRTGYADYVCQVLKDNGIQNVWVKVLDAVQVAVNNKWNTLGKAKCK